MVIFIAYSVFRRAHLHDDIAAAREMHQRQAAITGRHPDATLLLAVRQRGDSGARKPAMSHVRNI